MQPGDVYFDVRLAAPDTLGRPMKKLTIALSLTIINVTYTVIKQAMNPF